MLAAIEADRVSMPPEAASECAKRLLARYPTMKPHDAQTYTLELVAVFAAYPASIAKRVLDPVKGALAQSKYVPTIPEVNRALAGEVERRERIKANARAHLIEGKRRAEKRREQAEFEASRPSAEVRAQQAQKFVTEFKIMTERLKAND